MIPTMVKTIKGNFIAVDPIVCENPQKSRSADLCHMVPAERLRIVVMILEALLLSAYNSVTIILIPKIYAKLYHRSVR